MKMYEKLGMSTEAALKWVEDCERKSCVDCPAPGKTGYVRSAKCAAAYLLSEVPETPKVPRWKTVKTQEDIDKIFSDFDAMCRKNHFDKCNYFTFCLGNYPIPGCFYRYILELVDAPESEER